MYMCANVCALTTGSVEMATQSAVEVYGPMPDSGQCAVWLHSRQYIIA
jgi:hypothetical protein